MSDEIEGQEVGRITITQVITEDHTPKGRHHDRDIPGP